MSVQAREREGGGEEEEEEGRGLAAAAASSFAPSCMASSLEDASTHWGVLPTRSALLGGDPGGIILIEEEVDSHLRHAWICF